MILARDCPPDNTTDAICGQLNATPVGLQGGILDIIHVTQYAWKAAKKKQSS
jgi:hypothetical protein